MLRLISYVPLALLVLMAKSKLTPRASRAGPDDHNANWLSGKRISLAGPSEGLGYH
jgi:hypothetical protein